MGPMPRSNAATRPTRSVSSSTAAKPASPVTVVSGLPIRTLDRGCLDLRLFRRSVFTEQVPFNKVRIRASQHRFSLIDRASALQHAVADSATDGSRSYRAVLAQALATAVRTT